MHVTIGLQRCPTTTMRTCCCSRAGGLTATVEWPCCWDSRRTPSLLSLPAINSSRGATLLLRGSRGAGWGGCGGRGWKLGAPRRQPSLAEHPAAIGGRGRSSWLAPGRAGSRRRARCPGRPAGSTGLTCSASRPLAMISSRIAPAATPMIRPSPPNRETPPTTAAAIAISSQPGPTDGSATFSRPITRMPTTPASAALAT